MVLVPSAFLIFDNTSFANLCSFPSNWNTDVPAAKEDVTSKPFESYTFKSALTFSFTMLNSAVILSPVKFLFPSTGFKTTVPFPASTFSP